MKKVGEYYETKTAQLLQKLRPNEKVKANVKLFGKLSKQDRQIDVLVEPSDYSQLIFECKDRKRPIDLDVFGGLVSLLEDIKVEKAAMVSNSLYSDGVKNLAKAKNIDLLHIVDTNDSKIRTQLKATVLLIDSKINNSFQMDFESTATFSEAYPQDPVIKGPDFVGQGYKYLKHLWNNTDILSEETGSFKYLIENTSIFSIHGNLIPIDKITFRYSVRKEHYIGKIEIINTQGIYNVKECSYQTQLLKTAPITPYEAEKTWKLISEEEAKHVKTSIVVSCKSMLSKNLILD